MSETDDSRPGEPVEQGDGAEGFPHGSKYPPFVALGGFLVGAGLSLWYPILLVAVPVFAYGVGGWAHEYAIEDFERGIVPEQKRQILGVKSGYLAMILVITGELIIFLGLFVTWFYLDAVVGPFPTGGLPAPSLPLGAAMTAILLVGSVGIGGARWSIARDRRTWFDVGIAATLLSGLAFLGVLWLDWSHLMAAGLTWTTGAYGGVFYALTGVHAAHLLVGLVMLGLLAYRAWGRGHFSSNRHLMVKTVEAYWHFLTFVSILILAFVYYPTATG